MALVLHVLKLGRNLQCFLDIPLLALVGPATTCRRPSPEILTPGRVADGCVEVSPAAVWTLTPLNPSPGVALGSWHRFEFSCLSKSVGRFLLWRLFAILAMNIAVLISVILLCGAAAQEDSVAPTSGHNDPPGRNPCTRGPAFWCTSFDNADLCKAFDYCLHHVWVNETAGPAFDARMRLVSFLQGSVTKAMAELQPAGVAFTECDCEACKYIVNLFDSFFQRNSTQSLIETYFNKLCQNVPEPMRPMCTQTVEKHFMVLISAFGQIDPPKRCVEECDNVAAQSKQSRPRVINDVMPPPVNTCLCQVCQHVVKILDQELMKGDVQTGSLADFEMFCSYVSPASASNKCTEDAKKYIPELYSLLSHMDPLRTCNRFAFCKNSTFQVSEYGKNLW